MPAPPASPVSVSAACIRSLAMEPLEPWAALSPAELLQRAGQLELQLEWPRQDSDPRELSEIPEVRLWCLRADALNPWLPLVLERASGQLTRHVAMLLPHGFDRNEGIRFSEGSLDLWISHRLFLLEHWGRARGIECRQGLAQMAAVLGFELDPSFWATLD
ncbi:MAG: CRR6 family NdhI maturation factor [Synechococcaceae cyanobacterium]